MILLLNIFRLRMRNSKGMQLNVEMSTPRSLACYPEVLYFTAHTES